VLYVWQKSFPIVIRYSLHLNLAFSATPMARS
jgi:hypothetical protein